MGPSQPFPNAADDAEMGCHVRFWGVALGFVQLRCELGKLRGALGEGRHIPAANATPAWFSRQECSRIVQTGGSWGVTRAQVREEFRVPPPSLPAPARETSAASPLHWHRGLWQGPSARLGREEDTWPWGWKRGWERDTPSLLAADGGTEIAGVQFPRQRAHSMDIDRKKENPPLERASLCADRSDLGSVQHPPSSTSPSCSHHLQASQHRSDPSTQSRPSPQARSSPQGCQRGLRLWQRKERFLQRAKLAPLLRANCCSGNIWS